MNISSPSCNDKPRVDFVFPGTGSGVGGAELQALLYLDSFDRSLLDVALVLLGPNDRLSRMAIEADVSVTVLSDHVRSERRPSTWVSLSRHFRGRRTDIVYAFGLRADLPVRILLAFNRSVFLVSAIRGIESHRNPLARQLISRLTAWRVDHWLSNSRAGLRAAIRFDGANEHASSVIYNAVRLVEATSFQRAEWRSSVRTQLDISSDAFVIALIGNHRPLKRQHDLVSAISRLAMRGIPACGLLVGSESSYTQAIWEQATRLNVRSRIRSIGFAQDIRPFLAASDAQVLLSEQEGLPGALIEGIHFGLPIVATAVGGVPEIVGSESDTLLVAVGDLDAITERLAAIYEGRVDDGTSIALRARVVDLFNKTRMVEEVSELFLTGLNANRAGAHPAARTPPNS